MGRPYSGLKRKPTMHKRVIVWGLALMYWSLRRCGRCIIGNKFHAKRTMQCDYHILNKCMKQPLAVLKCLIVDLFFLSLRLIPEEVSMIEESHCIAAQVPIFEGLDDCWSLWPEMNLKPIGWILCGVGGQSLHPFNRLTERVNAGRITTINCNPERF